MLHEACNSQNPIVDHSCRDKCAVTRPINIVVRYIVLVRTRLQRGTVRLNRCLNPILTFHSGNPLEAERLSGSVDRRCVTDGANSARGTWHLMQRLSLGVEVGYEFHLVFLDLVRAIFTVMLLSLYVVHLI